MVDRKTIRPYPTLEPEPQDQAWLDSEGLAPSLSKEYAVDAAEALETGLESLNPQQHA